MNTTLTAKQIKKMVSNLKSDLQIKFYEALEGTKYGAKLWGFSEDWAYQVAWNCTRIFVRFAVTQIANEYGHQDEIEQWIKEYADMPHVEISY